MAIEKKRLTDILRAGNGGGNWIGGNWGDIPAAPERGPVPPGWYVAYAAEGALFTAGTGTPGYKVTFQIIEGEYKDRRCWLDIWLSEANKKNAKRDLGKLGIDCQEKLELPLPRGIRCEIRVTKRQANDGDEFNEVKEFRVLGIDPPQPDPFAPPPDAGQEGGPTP
jgi:hypothetical protein